MVAQTFLPIPSPEDQIFAPGIVFNNIACGMKERGHEVTVYAAEDSFSEKFETNGFGINSNHFEKDNYPVEALSKRGIQHQLYLISEAFEEYKKNKYDLLYLDSFPISEYFSNFVDGPIVCLHHGVPAKNSDLQLDVDRLRQKRYFNRVNFIAISENQRRMGKDYFNYKAVIHHGLNLDNFIFNENPQNDLLSLGRINPKKGTDVAINSAILANRKIDVWGDHSNDDFWLEKIKPKIDNQNVQYHGHCDFNKVGDVYRQARALLMPISWEEPFGLVVIEAMACGTPVIAYEKGSMAELIVDGITGYLIEPGDEKGIVEAISKIDQIDRKKCREHVEKNFSIEDMINKYEKTFEKIIKNEL